MKKILDENEMDGFTVSMAVFDCLPVIFFGSTVSILSLRFDSLLFFIGAFLVILGGALKCLWKFLVALAKKDVPILFYQMRVLMPLGFLLMMVSLAVDHKKLDFSLIWQSVISFPSLLFYLLGVAGMACMMIFAKKFDSDNPKHNWIEQGTNALAQLFILLGVLL